MWYVVLKSIIILIVTFSSIKSLLHCFLVRLLVTSLCLCFLRSEWYFILFSYESFWSHTSSISFSFNHNVLLLSTIVYIPFLLYDSWLIDISREFFCVSSTEASEFFVSAFISLYSLNKLFAETNFSCLINHSSKNFSNIEPSLS